ncbi:YTH domain-containing protein ECT2-like [Cicer arietinum]|uniref:YTH domain-containing protein ECT2-like n=1 Tax=Cicer arietinum TaxID=3827 RepID=UPI003CC544DE
MAQVQVQHQTPAAVSAPLNGVVATPNPNFITTSLYVGDLDLNVNDSQLYDLFNQKERDLVIDFHMATVANPTDQTTYELLKLSLDTQPKALEIPEPNKKPRGNQYGTVDSGIHANGQIPSYERSITPVLQDFMDPTMCYLPNGYPSTAYYYGAYGGTGNDSDDYSRYLNPEAVNMTSGVYGDNGSLLYHHGYGYAPYGPYSPAGSPVPTMGNDGQMYVPQHYQYPPYFQPLTPTSGPFTPTPAVHPQGDVSTSVAADQKPLSVEAANGNSNAVSNGVSAKGRTPTSGYQDPQFGFDGVRSPIPWLDSPIFSDGFDG